MSAAASVLESFVSGRSWPPSPTRHAGRHDLDDAAERVALALHAVDERARLVLRLVVAERVEVGPVALGARRLEVVAGGRRGRRCPPPRRRGRARGCRAPRGTGRRRAPAATRAAVSRAEERSTTLRASSRPRFSDAGEVGVTGARRVDRRQVLVRLVAVGHLEGDGVAGGLVVADAREEDDPVLLGPLSAAATAAPLTGGEARVDEGLGDGGAGGQAREDGRQARPRGSRRRSRG